MVSFLSSDFDGMIARMTLFLFWKSKATLAALPTTVFPSSAVINSPPKIGKGSSLDGTAGQTLNFGFFTSSVNPVFSID
jgi:hypothetical protein